MIEKEIKQGYQPKSCNLKNIVPPSVSTNVKPKKDGYTWEDLDKAWLEGFDTCKAKIGEANIKLNDELEQLKKQLEELPDKWCRNKDDYCPHLAKLEKENAELKEYNKYLRRKRQGGIQKQYNKVAIIKHQDEQLTKAKKLLQFVSEYEDMTCYADELEEIKQFLSEVEK